MPDWLGKLYVYGILILGSLFLVEWHSGLISAYFMENSHIAAERPQATNFKDAEEDPESMVARWEALSQSKDYEKLVEETRGRNDKMARAYRALAVLESGKFPSLLLETIQFLNKMVKDPPLPNDLTRRIILALGDPEEPGPSAKENLEAYKQIIAELRIATQASSLKKLAELEKLAEEEANR